MNKQEVRETEFIKDHIELNGSRFLIGNGFMGYRGTLEEFTKEQLVSLNMAGLFDKNGDLWRESVNLPNPFYTVCFADGKKIALPDSETVSHTQTLNIQSGLHSRNTVFKAGDKQITVTAERFLSMKDENLAVLKYTVSADKETEIQVKSSFDTDVWSLNGEHFAVDCTKTENNVGIICAHTLQNNIPVKLYEFFEEGENGKTVTVSADKPYTVIKICGVYWGEKSEGSLENFRSLIAKKYDTVRSEHLAAWEDIWSRSDVEISGDTDAQEALRYSIYHLCSIAPRHTDRCGIPARGLSGQVYKGAAFWDTEMFMLPFFSFTDKNVAKNLVSYRINTLSGAERKAAEFGYKGAFFPWESQETGDDACTLFNVTDVFTNRPMRTFFKDRQIHVSADMIYGLWTYCTVSGDYSLLKNGGMDLIYECLLFFYSYASFKPLKDRFEIHQVVGPDEYHERVDNNAFTCRMISYSADVFEKALAILKATDKDYYDKFVSDKDIDALYKFNEKLYVPQPNENGVIEQFDGYFGLEDISLDKLRERIIIPNEYWGGGNGLATTTRILKQADVVMMLNVFRAEYDREIKKANWEFYEPYTEHGSSLSACAYAIVAAEIGMTDWAYKYFLKTATVDLTGNSKQYLGSLYIGGTHPAANGGAWNTAIFGFAGVSYTDDALDISPRLPEKWNGLKFKLNWKGVNLSVNITKEKTVITADGKTDGLNITLNGQPFFATRG